MSDFLARLAERQISPVTGVAPRLPSRFASAPAQPIETAPEPRPVVGDNPVPARLTPATTADVPRVTHVVEVPLSKNAPREEQVPAVHHRREEVERHQPPSSPAPRRAPETPLVANIRRPPMPLPPAPVRTMVELPTLIPSRNNVLPARETDDEQPITPTRMELENPLVPRVAEAATVTQPAIAIADPPANTRPEPPVVRVTIGRIEVRAVAPPPPPAPAAREPHKPLSLDDYLERRHGARR